MKHNVQLLSIKLKSEQDLDREVKALNTNQNQSQNITTTHQLNRESLENVMENEQSSSSMQILMVDKTPNGTCGFHLTRTKWDPYPWVSGVDEFAPAKQCGVTVGDCVLKVNGCDVLGLRITEIAKLTKSRERHVTLHLWRSHGTCQAHDDDIACIWSGPMPRSMQRLALVVQNILHIIECPVCFTTIKPPAMQCQQGHLLCIQCRIRAVHCPICRGFYTTRPALIAEKIYTTLTNTFHLCHNEDKIRQKLFGRHRQQQAMIKNSLSQTLASKNHL